MSTRDVVLTKEERGMLASLVRMELKKKIRSYNRPEQQARLAELREAGRGDSAGPRLWRLREILRKLTVDTFYKLADDLDVARLQGLQTTCERGHIEMVIPVTTVDGIATFGSDADFCARMDGRRACEAVVIERTPIYQNAANLQ